MMTMRKIWAFHNFRAWSLFGDRWYPVGPPQTDLRIRLLTFCPQAVLG